MSLLREAYSNLENQVKEKYKGLVRTGDFDILTQKIKKHCVNPLLVLEDIDKEGLMEADFQWGALQYLDQINWFDRKGNERFGYLLGVSKNKGVDIFDYNNGNRMFIHFDSLYDIHSKLTVVETLDSMVF